MDTGSSRRHFLSTAVAVAGMGLTALVLVDPDVVEAIEALGTLTLLPITPAPDQIVQVSGSGFVKNVALLMIWEDDIYADRVAVQTDALGKFVASIHAPSVRGAHRLLIERLQGSQAVTVADAPVVTPTPTPAPTGGLLAMAASSRSTEVAGWDDTTAEITGNPLYTPGSAVSNAIRDILKPRFVRWMPYRALAEGMPVSVIQTILRAIHSWGAVPWIKGPTHGSTNATDRHYTLDQWSAADVISRYLALGDVFAVECPNGFVWESANEPDLGHGQAAAGTACADHWNQVFVPVRKAFTAKYPTLDVVWGGPAITNVGSPRYGNVTSPYLEPVNAFWAGLKTAYTAASATDKPFIVPSFFSWHYYLSDGMPDWTTWTNAQWDVTATYVGVCAKAFKVAADAAFPGAGIKMALSEWNTSQFGFYANDWPTVCAYTYPKVDAACKANGVWQAIQFLSYGDSIGWPITSGTPDLLKVDGSLLFGGPSFVSFT